jgi:hypothetical protein
LGGYLAVISAICIKNYIDASELILFSANSMLLSASVFSSPAGLRVLYIIKKTKPFMKQLLMLFVMIAFVACAQKKESSKKPDVDIHTAVVTDNVEAVRQHIAAGTNLNEKDPFGGSSPLISASVFGKPEIAKILIDAGADVNFQNNDGSTALHTAAFFCHPDIVKMLLDKGADKTIKNKYGATAYESVVIPFKDAKDGYDMMGQILGPMGLTLDYSYIEKTRPVIAGMLR